MSTAAGTVRRRLLLPAAGAVCGRHRALFRRILCVIVPCVRREAVRIALEVAIVGAGVAAVIVNVMPSAVLDDERHGHDKWVIVVVIIPRANTHCPIGFIITGCNIASRGQAGSTCRESRDKSQFWIHRL